MTLPGALSPTWSAFLACGLICGSSSTTTETKPASASMIVSRKTVPLSSSPNWSKPFIASLRESRGPLAALHLAELDDAGQQIDRPRREDLIVDHEPDVEHRADERGVQRHRHAADERGHHRADRRRIGTHLRIDAGQRHDETHHRADEAEDDQQVGDEAHRADAA